MSWESFMSNLELLEFIRSILFIALFVFATSYLIPKGIVSFREWKQNSSYRKLITSVTFYSGGVSILIYLLAIMIISHAKVI